MPPSLTSPFISLVCGGGLVNLTGLQFAYWAFKCARVTVENESSVHPWPKQMYAMASMVMFGCYHQLYFFSCKVSTP